jgi:hypothetical protein
VEVEVRGKTSKDYWREVGEMVKVGEVLVLLEVTEVSG